MRSIARKPGLSCRRMWETADPNARSYENLAPKVYRMDSLDSSSYGAEKGARGNELRRADDYV